MKHTLIWGLALLLSAFAAIAAEGGIRVESAWARATPPVAPVAAAYLVVINDGDTPDRLLRIDSGIARRIEMHRTANENGVMRMRPIEGGAVIPARGRLEFAPGGNHLMLIGPVRPLVAGETFEATLVFERAGPRKVRFEVRGMDGNAPMHMH
ncbi:MAG: copper chaperone PCu(A)C [Thermomonas sp.]|uniref:copper chaperone PCu(A)C n=1 Tax=Thermomonas sp. TaxID=1971895 RepID=UPI001D4D56BE|nr:copper chaperone PCu(A)C [Thermomonas sp.]MBZ0087279.1 copper chaperone PCu(A)C [Thermomonas sp.]MCO5055227.1 copper chaperone PCu(A)C [Thermomonas sp.]